MTHDWHTVPFDQAVEINPPVPLVQGEVYPFVDMQAVEPSSRTVGPSEFRVFTGSGSRFQNGDTLMARITPCLENGKIARFYNSEDALTLGHGSTEFIVIRGREGVTDNDFAYYLTRSELVRSYAISQMTGTSGRQRVPVSALSHLNIPLPPLPEQRAIAHILGTLDDKIELNRRMNATLEAIARAIFQSWFVDFDPVHAKARGEQPAGMDAEMAALFPDSFEESELGMIPRGWRVSTVGDEFDITMGQSPPGNTYNETGEGMPFYQGRRDFGFRYPAVRVFCTEPTRFAQAGDTLISVRAPVGDINMALDDCSIGRGVAAVRHKLGYRSYTYYMMKSLDFSNFEAEGTVFGSLSGENFRAMLHVVPPLQLVECFETILFPLDELIEMNERQVLILTQLRDALLPKLISGEMRVEDAERIVTEMMR